MGSDDDDDDDDNNNNNNNNNNILEWNRESWRRVHSYGSRQDEMSNF